MDCRATSGAECRTGDLDVAIAYQTSVVDGVLCVKASGEDDSSDEVKQYGMAIIEQAVAHDVRKIICDERELKYALDTLETFEAAKFIAEMAPRLAQVAIVCAPRYLKDGMFWETVAVNRGLLVRVDTDYEASLAWVRSDP